MKIPFTGFISYHKYMVNYYTQMYNFCPNELSAQIAMYHLFIICAEENV